MDEKKTSTKYMLHGGIAWRKEQGYTVSRGKVMKPDGTVKPAPPFYLGWDQKEAATKKRIVETEWLKIKRNGGKVWTSEAFANLRAMGVITEKKGLAQANHALAVYSEPLTDDELKPFVDENGEVLRECALMANEVDALNVIKTAESRSRFHVQVRDAYKIDPWGTLERLKQFFGWGAKEAGAFLNIYTGTATVNPIAGDASEHKGTNVLDVLEGDGGAVDGGD